MNAVLARAHVLFAAAGAVFAMLWVVPAAAIESVARQALLIDVETGTVLLEKEADTLMPPASMSKLMTVYLVFERLNEGSLTLDDTFAVSETAWRKGGSKMFVGVDTRVRVEDLLRGVIVQSGNDASIVLAEGLSGTEDAFAEEMTRRSREIGLVDSVFRNATGWPDPEHLMTARDLSILASRVIQDFPQYYPYFAEKEFTYNNIKQGNRNPLLYRDVGADGLKTGHTQDSGFGLVASAVRNDRRLILVINGLDSVNQRTRESERLLDWGFREFKNYELFEPGETVIDVPVWLGEDDTIPIVLEAGLTVTLTRAARRGLKVAVIMDGPPAAPVAKGTEIGRLVISAPDAPAIELPLLAGRDVGRLGVVGRLGAAVGYLIWGQGAP
ncbi:MAG TPA: D-alanyl-D-alanine carboxypeptidase family protein [Alphaproteobacteria bacterium]|nr:D-alanyl-D-alanine carboxypeptidase family protein [Alphaproteobacteria bacterium]